MKSYNHVYEDEAKLKEFFSKLPRKENLIQVFSGIIDKKKIKQVVSQIKKHYPNAKIIGATTDGEIVGNEITQHKIVINVTLFDKVKIKTLLIKKEAKSFEMAKTFAKKLLSDDSNVLIVFTDGLYTNGEEFVKGIEEVKKLTIAGGLAGDNGAFKETYVFDGEDIIEKGCVGAVLEGDVYVHNDYSFNWQGLGKVMTVTKAVKNRVYEIDNKPPAELYKYYFGEDDVVKIGIQFPLIVDKGGIKVARAVLSQKDDGSLVFAGNIDEGEKVQFGFGDVGTILEKDKVLFEHLKEYEVESVFIYSCMARRRFLGSYVKKEIAPFAKVANVSGFFTYGEFFSSGHNTFFNETLTVLVLSEHDRKVKFEYEDEKNEFSVIKPLTRLIKVTSEELTELNEHLQQKVEEKTKEVLAKNKHLEYMFYHNQLTGLPNRFMLDKDLKSYDIYGGLLVDIKGFSKINDMYGEMVGDDVLRNVGQILNKFAPAGTKVYKVGADQFMIVAYEETNFDKLVEEIKEFFANELIMVHIEDSLIALDVEVRMVLVRGNFKDIKIKMDLALNYARKHFKDFIEYDESLKLEERLKNELKVLEMVKQAIREDRIVPVFQRIKKESGDSYECLVRLKEENKLIPPGYFLEIIEPTHYYYEITKIMIEKSFKIFSKRNETISINFSFKDIENPEVVDFLIEKVKEYSMEGRVIIEVLESENIKDFEVVLDFINKIKKVGVKIAIDDFGSGYSNFVYIAKLNPDFIKIDGSLIRNIHEDESSYVIARHIHSFAKELGCKTIAEFVSSEEIFNKVSEIGVDGMQGYYVDAPKESV